MTTPIAAAVLPQKAASVARAVALMQSLIGRTKGELIMAGMNIDVFAPRPRGTEDRATYKRKLARNDFVTRITIPAPRKKYGDPMIAADFNEEGIARLLAEAAEDAAAEFDAYVAKLEAKVGTCDSAEVTGHIWQYSILTVKKGDATEKWRTQQILNVSVLGKVFNQWPTRKLTNKEAN